MGDRCVNLTSRSVHSLIRITQGKVAPTSHYINVSETFTRLQINYTFIEFYDQAVVTENITDH